MSTIKNRRKGSEGKKGWNRAKARDAHKAHKVLPNSDEKKEAYKEFEVLQDAYYVALKEWEWSQYDLADFEKSLNRPRRFRN